MKYLKQVVSLLLSIVIFASGFPVTVFAQNTTSDNISMYESTNNELEETFNGIEFDTEASDNSGITQELNTFDSYIIQNDSSNESEDGLWYEISDVAEDESNNESSAELMTIEPYTTRDTENGVAAVVIDESPNEAIQIKDEILTDNIEKKSNGIPAYHAEANDRNLSVKVNKRAADGVLIGDVNKDDAVNKTDLTILSRNLAKWESDETAIASSEAADIDGDDEITAKDRLILARYLSGWDEYEEYFVVEEEIQIDPPTITSITEDCFGKVTVFWTPVDNAVTYYLYEQMADGTLTLLATTEENMAEITVIKSGEHSYAVSALCDIESVGREKTEISEIESIYVHIIWVTGIAIKSLSQSGINEVTITWTDINPIDTYSVYEVYDGEYSLVSSSLKQTKTVISGIPEGEHLYAVKGNYTDAQGNTWETTYSGARKVMVLSEAEFSPAPPELLFVDGNEFSKESSNTPVYRLQDFFLEWNECEGAEKYGIKIEKRIENNRSLNVSPSNIDVTNMRGILNDESFINSEYGNDDILFEDDIYEEKSNIESRYLENDALLRVIEDDIYEYEEIYEDNDIEVNDFVLGGEQLEFADVDTVYRLSVWSIGEQTGDSNEYYFTITPEDAAIKVDDAELVHWDRSNPNSGTRVFGVSAVLPWKASCTEDWVYIEPYENKLTITLDTNYEIDARTATVNVSNGINEAIIQIKQGEWDSRNAPQLYYQGKELSQDKNIPTMITTGDFSFDYEKNGAKEYHISVYEKQSDGTWKSKFRTRRDPLNFKYNDSYDTQFSTGKEFRLRVSGHMSTYSDWNVYNTAELLSDDVVYNWYYFTMTDENRYLDINGQENPSFDIWDDLDLDINTSNSVEVTTSDTWLHLSVDDEYLSQGTVDLEITADFNETGAVRIGHVEVVNGDLVRTITLSQRDMIPKITNPASVSEVESSPTSYSTNTVVFEAVGDWFVLEKKTSSGYDEPYSDCSFKDRIIAYALEKGATYRLTVISSCGNEERSKVYYFKTTATKGSGIMVNGPADGNTYRKESEYSINGTSKKFTVFLNSNASWTATSDVSWLTLSKKSGISGQEIEIDVTASVNSSGEDRKGTIEFKNGTTKSAYFTVYQYGSHPIVLYTSYNGSYKINDDGLQNLDFGGVNYLPITVYSGSIGSPITVTASENWIKTDKNIESGASINITINQNADAQSRTGYLTMSNGYDERTIMITQTGCINSPRLSSPNISDDITAPTLYDLQNEDLVLTWNAVNGATSYEVELIEYDNNIQYIYIDEIIAENNSQFESRIPINVFDLSYTGKYNIFLKAFNAFGHDSYTRYCFLPGYDDTVFINGFSERTWKDVNDYRDSSSSYTITSTGSWSAVPNVPWIVLNKTSGVDKDTLTVTVKANTGGGRTGKVTVTCGSASAVLTINQFGTIDEFPQLIEPNFSKDEALPTVIPMPETLYFQWPYEAQAKYYYIRIYCKNPKLVNSDGWEFFKSSGKIAKGETDFEFTDLVLVPGDVYKVVFERYRPLGNGGYSLNETAYYYTIETENSFLELSKQTISCLGEHRNYLTTVRSSGMWTASVTDDWLLIGPQKYSEKEIEDGLNPDDYKTYIGKPGSSLYITILPNTTGRKRVGYVDVMTAGASARVEITQKANYDKPIVVSPVLSDTPSKPSLVPFGNVALNWTEGYNNVGSYTIMLTNQDTSECVWSESRVRTLSWIIPSNVLKEGVTYRLKLSTELNNEEGSVSSSYYFKVGGVNRLSLSASVDWSAVETGGYVRINASAAGGSGSYLYSHQLICEGNIEAQTDLGPYSTYAFLPQKSGSYQVRVFVVDSVGESAEHFSNYTKSEAKILSVNNNGGYRVTEDVDQAYQILKYTLYSDDSWSVKDHADWITPSETTGTGTCQISILVDKNESLSRVGKITFVNNRTGFTATLTVYQESDIQIVLNQPETIVTEQQQNVYIMFSAAEQWRVATNSKWVTLSESSGNPGSRTIYARVSQNTEEDDRTAEITFSAGGQQLVYTIRQVGTLAEGSIGISNNTWQIDTPEADILSLVVSTASSWSIESCPEWVKASATNGTGSSSITLYAEGNPDKGVRRGTVVFYGAGQRRELYISQSGIDVAATVASYSMDKSTATTGEEVVFTIKTKMADQVQLVVDGSAYEVYNVYNNQITFTREFSSAGDRRIRIMPLRNGVEGILSNESRLIVTSAGVLDEPYVSVPDSILLGNPLTVSWSSVANAEKYSIYFGNGNWYRKVEEVSASQTSYEIPIEKLSEAGVYDVAVIASAVGYSQSERSATFRVIEPVVDFAISSPHNEDGFETNDIVYLQLDNPSQYYIRFEISHDDRVWYIPEDNAVNDSFIDLQFVIPEQTGQYEVRARAYATATQGKTEFWNTSGPDPVTFDVVGGMIKNLWIGGINLEYLNKGNKVTNTSQFGVGSLGIITNMSIERIEVTRDGTLLDTLTKEDGEYNDYSYQYSIDETGQVSEGEHVYKIVAYDKNNQVIEYEPYTLYVYTPITRTVKYPHDSSTPMLRFPSDSTGSKLTLNEKITVLGTYGSYYFAIRENGKIGFVQKNKLFDDLYIDWNSLQLYVDTWASDVEDSDVLYSDTIHITNKPYSITINWNLSSNLPKNTGYNVYLVPDMESQNANYNSVKLNNGILYENKLIVSTNDFAKLFKTNSTDEAGYAKLRVELIDSSNGSVKVYGESCGRWISNGGDAKKSLDNLKKVIDLTIVPHDIIFKGEASINGEKKTSKTVKEITDIGKLYDIATDNGGSIEWTPLTKGMTVAESIIRDVAEKKGAKAWKYPGYNEVKWLFEFIGFEVDSAELENKLSMLVDQINKYVIVRDGGDYYSEDYQNSVTEATEKFLKSYNEHKTIANIKKNVDLSKSAQLLKFAKEIADIFNDWIMYSNVTRQDVQQIINEFYATDDTTLLCAADVMIAMTESKGSLVLHLIRGYGLEKGRDYVFSATYKALLNLLPPEYRYMVKLGVKLGKTFNKYAFNTSGMLAKAYDLVTLSEATDVIACKYEQFFYVFSGSPTGMYDEEKGITNYDQYLILKNVYLNLLKIEFKRFNEFANENEKGFVAWLDRKLRSREKYSIDVEKTIELYDSTVSEAFEVVKGVWVDPYTN